VNTNTKGNKMEDNKKVVNVEFAPGCFDQFDGSQDELDELVKQIQKMFSGKTHDEIKSMSVAVEADQELDQFASSNQPRVLQ
jgi:hypothetical protein